MTEDNFQEEPHYLLDSNIISEIIKPSPCINVMNKIAENNSDCAICTPVWQKLLYGLYKMEEGIRRKYLESFIQEDVHEEFSIKPYSEKAVKIHARMRAELEKLEQPVSKDDSMIASIAVANHMVLVTRNTKHYEPIQKVCDLEIENWFE